MGKLSNKSIKNKINVIDSEQLTLHYKTTFIYKMNIIKSIILKH